jgi:tRNA(Ile2) C34 agmatinyltransferase TiaS
MSVNLLEEISVIYIGLDDTDNKDSRGTGRLARAIAGELSKQFAVQGVTRHQLLVDPRVPYTSHNSSAALHLPENGMIDLNALADQVQAMMLADFQAGSDPGLCVARSVTPEVVAFGRKAQTEVVHQQEAHDVAKRCGCILRGLGGTRDGVIGALASVGLAATGDDGRFILIGAARDLEGTQTVQTILASGIVQVRTVDGQPLTDGLVETGKLRPAFREGRPILFVTRDVERDLWLPIRLD